MNIISSHLLEKQLDKEIDLIQSIVSSIQNKSLSTTVDNRIVKVSPLEFLFVYTSLSLRNSETSSYRKPFLDLFQSLETASPGSAYIGAHMLVHGCDLGKPKLLGRTSSRVIFSMLSKLLSQEENQVVQSIIESGGGFKKSHFENLNLFNEYVIKAKSGESISLDIEREFLSKDSLCLGLSNIIFCDSVFEKMSELDNVVNWCNASQRPLILVARGFLPEVTSTLSYNYINGKLKILPCSLEYSDDDPFNLDDTARMCGTSTILGPLSIYDNSKLDDLSGEIKDARIKNRDFRVTPMVSHDIEVDINSENMSPQRLSRVSRGSIKVSIPRNASLIEKSRITKGVHLYRQYSRSHLISLEKFEFPVTMNSYKRILKSVETFLKDSKRTKYYIKE